MARKRKKARRAANPKKRTHKRRRTTARRRANPAKRTHARRKRRRANPTRHHARRRVTRRRSHARRSNPSRRRRTHRRRNPGELGNLAIGLGVAAAGFLATQAIGYFVTSDQVANGQRDRAIIGAVIAGGGFYLMRKRPVLGAGLAIGATLGAIGGWLTLKLFSMLPAKSQSTTAGYSQVLQGYQQQLQAVYQNNLAAVYQNNLAGMAGYLPMQGMAAVYQNNLAGMGAIGDTYTPPAPWTVATPF